jgi:hypothetical protein
MKEKRSMMWRLFAVFGLAGVNLVAATAVQARSPPVTFTDTFAETDTFTDVVPCREELGAYTITLNLRGVFHVTAAGIDEEGNFVPPYHVTNTTTGTFFSVPSDGTGPTFTGRFAGRVGETEFLAPSTGTSTSVVRGTGSDGSQISFRLVTHYTINALGVEFGFEKLSC